MHLLKRASFSSDNKYFACISSDEDLLIWETFTNVFIDCKFDSNIYNTCTSIHWIPPQPKHVSSKKAKMCRAYTSENNLLAVGTVKGDILLYNVENKNLYLHLVGRHSDSVNDMCFYSGTNSFFTCSSDKHIGIWDITSGKQISKWKADDSPVSSICVIDGNNLLSFSTSILWWNISKKSVIKKFSGHSTEIYKLLPVNAGSVKSYFLSAALNDTKINAWSLNLCKIPVASFVLPAQPEDIDVFKASTKDKPLVLSAVTKDGFLHLFEHILNGNVNDPVHPKVSIEIGSEFASASFISLKLSPDSDSCNIAYGSSKSDITFKHIKIKQLLKSESENFSSDKTTPPVNLPVVNDINKDEKNLSINGLKAPPSSESNPKKVSLKNVDSVVSGYRRKLRSSSIPPLSEAEKSNCIEIEGMKGRHNMTCKKDVDLKDPVRCIDALLKALEAHNESIIEVIFHNNDVEFITACIRSLPINSLRNVLDELNHRLHHKYTPALHKWIKEILKNHLRYLSQTEDAAESLNEIKKHIDSKEVNETIYRTRILKGILSHHIQDSNSDESDSEREEPMDL